jgi:hypothetical protein
MLSGKRKFTLHFAIGISENFQHLKISINLVKFAHKVSTIELKRDMHFSFQKPRRARMRCPLFV